MPNPVSLLFPVLRLTALERRSIEILVFQPPQLNLSLSRATHKLISRNVHPIARSGPQCILWRGGAMHEHHFNRAAL